MKHVNFCIEFNLCHTGISSDRDLFSTLYKRFTTIISNQPSIVHDSSTLPPSAKASDYESCSDIGMHRNKKVKIGRYHQKYFLWNAKEK